MIIGAGGVGTVVAHKCAQHPEVFSEIVLASRTLSKCDAIAERVAKRTGHNSILTDRVDAMFTRKEVYCKRFGVLTRAGLR